VAKKYKYDVPSAVTEGIPQPSAPQFLSLNRGVVKDPVSGRFISGQLVSLKEGRRGYKQARELYNKMVPKIAGTRLSIDYFLIDSAYPSLDAWRRYIEMGKLYLSKEGGGIIGDSIKDEYFTHGHGKFAPLAEPTIKHKAWMARKGKIKPTVVAHPLWRRSSLPDLPGGWRSYTSVFGFPQNKGLSEAGSRIFPSALIAGRETWWEKVALMDAVATMNPKMKFWGKTNIKTYNQMVKSAGSAPVLGANDPTSYTRMQVTGVMEAFRLTPSAFAHELGYTNTKTGKRVPARPFISRGTYEGLKRVSHFWEIYMADGEVKMRKAYKDYMRKVLSRSHKMVKEYMSQGRKATLRYVGKGGMTDLPRAYTYHALGDTTAKYADINLTVRGMFGNHLIWWFLPPSKWWHYVGVMDDLRSIIKHGVWSLGAIQAWVAAMMKGILGARMGSPIPFTRKARRRKFRKSLYSRAGYHRQYVGGAN